MEGEIDEPDLFTATFHVADSQCQLSGFKGEDNSTGSIPVPEDFVSFPNSMLPIVPLTFTALFPYGISARGIIEQSNYDRHRGSRIKF